VRPRDHAALADDRGELGRERGITNLGHVPNL
jgi:hypothetical protein